MSVGCLSTTITPTFKGMPDFKGRILHTGQWPREKISFEGRRVGVIGTGSSAVQAIPLIAAEAAHLDVFQRTANYVVPAQNRILTREEVAAIKADYKGFRALAKTRPSASWFPHHTDSAVGVSAQERFERFEAQWGIGGLPFLGAFGDLLTNPEANRLVAAYWTKKIREVVKDERTAEFLTPRGDIFGCKRLCSGTGYYEAFNRPNVTLVDVHGSGIDRFTSAGLMAGGREYPLDDIVCATGFDAMTGSVTRIAIKGRGGKTIQEAWSDGPSNYLGLAVAEFPNMFNMVSVGGPSVLATMVTCSEQHGDLIAEMLSLMRERGLAPRHGRDGRVGQRDRGAHREHDTPGKLAAHDDHLSQKGANEQHENHLWAPQDNHCEHHAESGVPRRDRQIVVLMHEAQPLQADVSGEQGEREQGGRQLDARNASVGDGGCASMICVGHHEISHVDRRPHFYHGWRQARMLQSTNLRGGEGVAKPLHVYLRW